jgi:hypothetical protein
MGQSTVKLYATTEERRHCGFLERARGHYGDFTCGSGTFCSDCGERVFNPHYTGARDVEGDMEIVDKLRKKGVKIPKDIQDEILEFQEEVNWKPRWKF